jgi:hypothetical protein
MSRSDAPPPAYRGSRGNSASIEGIPAESFPGILSNELATAALKRATLQEAKAAFASQSQVLPESCRIPLKSASAQLRSANEMLVAPAGKAEKPAVSLRAEATRRLRPYKAAFHFQMPDARAEETTRVRASPRRTSRT